jgi:hypothetical protein
MVACLSPSDAYLDENLSTLSYASRAQSIKNKPVKNQDPTTRAIHRLKEQMSLLKRQLVEAQNVATAALVVSVLPALTAHCSTVAHSPQFAVAISCYLQLEDCRRVKVPRIDQLGCAAKDLICYDLKTLPCDVLYSRINYASLLLAIQEAASAQNLVCSACGGGDLVSTEQGTAGGGEVAMQPAGGREKALKTSILENVELIRSMFATEQALRSELEEAGAGRLSLDQRNSELHRENQTLRERLEVLEYSMMFSGADGGGGKGDVDVPGYGTVGGVSGGASGIDGGGGVGGNSGIGGIGGGEAKQKKVVLDELMFLRRANEQLRDQLQGQQEIRREVAPVRRQPPPAWSEGMSGVPARKGRKGPGRRRPGRAGGARRKNTNTVRPNRPTAHAEALDIGHLSVDALRALLHGGSQAGGPSSVPLAQARPGQAAGFGIVAQAEKSAASRNSFGDALHRGHGAGYARPAAALASGFGNASPLPHQAQPMMAGMVGGGHRADSEPMMARAMPVMSKELDSVSLLASLMAKREAMRHEGSARLNNSIQSGSGHTR